MDYHAWSPQEIEGAAALNRHRSRVNGRMQTAHGVQRETVSQGNAIGRFRARSPGFLLDPTAKSPLQGTPTIPDLPLQKASMFTGQQIVAVLCELNVTHVIWIPDTTTGTWEHALETSPAFQLIRVCREGEAWPLAGGLLVGGSQPVVLIQNTGFIESGDSMRNIVFDLGLPVFAIIGARNWQNEQSTDTARRFTLPLVRAWGVDYAFITCPEERGKLVEHFHRCREANQAGIVLLAE